MIKSSEQELLDGAKQWDLVALVHIYDRYSPGIYGYAMRLLGNDHQAEDCVSETFTRFLNILQRGQGPEAYLQAYLYRIAHNWITDFYRRQPPAQLDLDESMEDADQHLPEENWNERLEKHQIKMALFSLTPDQRQVILLRFFECWDNKEIAAALGKPIGAIKALQHRGITTLRTILLKEKGDN